MTTNSPVVKLEKINFSRVEFLTEFILDISFLIKSFHFSEITNFYSGHFDLWDMNQNKHGRPAEVKVGQLKSFKNKYLE